jgi:hypothetical protein
MAISSLGTSCEAGISAAAVELTSASQDTHRPRRLAPLNFSAARSVSPLAANSAKPAQCYENSTRCVIERGGCCVSGWALADYGPMATNPGVRPLYCRWIHHVVWADSHRRLWEVTPYIDVCNQSIVVWMPSLFIADPKAKPRIALDGSCQMLPARYVAIRLEGRDVADCLNQLQQASPEQELFWVGRATYALRNAGFALRKWRIERLDGRINNAWLFADETANHSG